MAENTKTTVLANLYKYFGKPLFFLHDPEDTHDKITNLGSKLGRSEVTRQITRMVFDYEHSSLEQNILGIRFRNPIGLSAGFDKDANLIDILQSVGFGFEQVGTVTYRPYKGNKKPRLYRLPKSKALVVYYGLKNEGIKKIIKKIKKRETIDFPLGISIGKTNAKYTASTKGGIKDFYDCLKKTIDSNIGDFYTINISCPNSYGGESLATPVKLDKLLKQLYSLDIDKPVFLKMPINIGWKETKTLLEVSLKYKVDGIIYGNLNKDRKLKGIKDDIPKNINGATSGLPNKVLVNKLVENTYKEYENEFIIVGVGGIFSGKDAYEMIKKGATLVQLITGMIYEGPQLIGEINRNLVELMEKDGYKNISEAVGSGVKE